MTSHKKVEAGMRESQSEFKIYHRQVFLRLNQRAVNKTTIVIAHRRRYNLNHSQSLNALARSHASRLCAIRSDGLVCLDGNVLTRGRCPDNFHIGRSTAFVVHSKIDAAE